MNVDFAMGSFTSLFMRTKRKVSYNLLNEITGPKVIRTLRAFCHISRNTISR